MHKLLSEQGLKCHNYDLKDGAHCDLTDDAVWDPILRDTAAGEYGACFASPECTTFSQLHNKPGGPPPLRDATGPGRYGKKGPSRSDREKIQAHTLVAVRVAQVLDLFTIRGFPWIFEAPEASENQASVFNSDEYVALLAQ